MIVSEDGVDAVLHGGALKRPAVLQLAERCSVREERAAAEIDERVQHRDR